MTISRSSYRAAQKVAPVLEEHFRRFSTAQAEKSHAPVPDALQIESILDVAFWASLRREEGYSPKVSLAFLPPDYADHSLQFEHRQRLSTENLTKISPGVERPGIHVGIWHEQGNLYIWGTTRGIPDNCFVVDVSEPGLLVVKHRRFHGFGKFANVAVLTGDSIKVVDKENDVLPDCPEVVTSLLGSSSNYDYSLNVMIQLAVSMRRHGRGGTILFVPSGNEHWRKSIVRPIKYNIVPSYDRLKALMQTELEKRNDERWQNVVSTEVEAIAGYTAVDGALVMAFDFEVFAYGTKIIMSDADHHVAEMSSAEPIEGAEVVVLNPAQHGGTRHLSAAQFIYDHHDCMAFVASQDGRFTVFNWSNHRKMVQAFRIDGLLI